jgi:hypothetical protein
MRWIWTVLAPVTVFVSPLRELAAQHHITLAAAPEVVVEAKVLAAQPVSWASVSAGGVIAISQGPGSPVRLFGSDGRHVAWIPDGREAVFAVSSPHFGWIGDSLWVFDDASNQIRLYSTRGTLIRSAPANPRLGAPVARSNAAWSRPVALAGDGSFILRTARTADPNDIELGPPPPDRLAHMKSDGSGERRLGAVPADVSELNIPLGQKFATVNVPFRARPRVRPSKDGLYLAMVGPENDAGELASVRVTVIGARGDTAFSRVVRTESPQIAKQSVDSAIARMVARTRIPKLAEAIPSAIRHGIPSARDVQADAWYTPDGRTWVALRPPGRPTLCRVYDTSGTIIGDFSLPAGAVVADVGRDQLLVSEQASNGLQTLVRYRIVSGRP